MADTSIRTPAPGANPPDTFDPATWLHEFRTAGGWWATGSDNRPFVGWKIEGFTDEQHALCRALWRMVEHKPERRDAIRTYLLATAGQVL